MFGRNDDKTTSDTNSIPDESIHGALHSDSSEPAPPAPPAPASEPAVVHPTSPPTPLPPPSTPTPPGPPTPPTPPGPDPKPWQHPGTPLSSDSSPGSEDTPHELIDIKQQALSQLSPLVSHLDQTPEEQFKTTMMMIQASDDQTMVKAAYEAAQKITDEKARAQALLDIVNEINYFTQHHSG